MQQAKTIVDELFDEEPQLELPPLDAEEPAEPRSAFQRFEDEQRQLVEQHKQAGAYPYYPWLPFSCSHWHALQLPGLRDGGLRTFRWTKDCWQPTKSRTKPILVGRGCAGERSERSASRRAASPPPTEGCRQRRRTWSWLRFGKSSVREDHCSPCC